jgi:hypothetical protein
MLQPIEHAPVPSRATVDRAVAIASAAVEELEQLVLAAIAARAMALAYECTEEIEAAKEELAKAAAPGRDGYHAIDRARACLSRAREHAREAQHRAEEYDRFIARLGRAQ